MKQFVSRGLMVATVLGAALAALPASAQEAVARVGFVNTDRLLREASPARAAQSKLEQEFSRREKEIDDTGDMAALAGPVYPLEGDELPWLDIRGTHFAIL